MSKSRGENRESDRAVLILPLSSWSGLRMLGPVVNASFPIKLIRNGADEEGEVQSGSTSASSTHDG